MGCNEATDDECLDDEKPGRYVQVKAYEIMKFEVTNEQYDLCTKLHPGKCSGFFPGKPAAKEPVPNTRCTKQPWLPVCAYQDSVKIMFEEFCETMIPGGRLPTEAEWEKAARGGCETTVGDCQTAARKYPWGQSPGPCLALQGCAYSHSCYVFQPWSCPGLAVLRVPGTDPGDVSPYGVYDMVSNASEQVGDVYFADWYQKAPPVDPRTPEPHAGSLMRRGGDGMYGPKRHRASFRQSPNNLIVYRLGFRCARDVPAGP
jgi:formylglycine-generating enzyme required for sulfatase activity